MCVCVCDKLPTGAFLPGASRRLFISFKLCYVEHETNGKKLFLTEKKRQQPTRLGDSILKSPMLSTSNSNATRAFHTKCTIWIDFNKNEITYYATTIEKIQWERRQASGETESIIDARKPERERHIVVA